MGYIEKNLVSGETVYYKSKYHWSYTFFAFLALILLGVILIGIYIFGKMMIAKITTELIITNNRMVYKRGFVKRLVEEINLERIEEINLVQSFWGRIFGFGVLRINGQGGNHITTHTIDDPTRFRNALAEAKEYRRTS